MSCGFVISSSSHSGSNSWTQRQAAWAAGNQLLRQAWPGTHEQLPLNPCLLVSAFFFLPGTVDDVLISETCRGILPQSKNATRGIRNATKYFAHITYSVRICKNGLYQDFATHSPQTWNEGPFKMQKDQLTVIEFLYLLKFLQWPELSPPNTL